MIETIEKLKMKKNLIVFSSSFMINIQEEKKYI